MFNKPLPRLVKIALWTVFSFFAVCLLAVLFIFTVVLTFDVYGDEGLHSPEIRGALGLWIYILLIAAWFIFTKKKSFKKFIYDAIPFLTVGLLLYFWFQASDTEYRLGDSWTMDPLGHTAYATLAYIRALIKSVITIGTVILFHLYFKKQVE